MTVLQALPPCRRRALLALGLGSVSLALAWVAKAGYMALSDSGFGLLIGLGGCAVFASALLWFMPDTSDAVPKPLLRRYYRDMVPAMTAYIGVMLVWKKLLNWVEAPVLRVLVALLPALLVVWIMRGFVRYVRDSDEMQRRIELESGASAAMLLSAVYMAAGFLQTAKLIDIPAKVAMLWVFPGLCFTYGITKVFISRRYA